MVASHALGEAYLAALRAYVASPDEEGRERAYGIGRAALAEGLGVLDVADTHRLALRALLGADPRETTTTVDRASAFLAECLAPFEMSHRGFQEANESLGRLNRELEEKAEALSRSNADLEMFAYVASHDLQEPLRMVASYMQLLERRYGGSLDGEAHEFIRFAVDGAKRMQELINGLLAYSRAGSHSTPLTSVQSETVLSQVLANLSRAIDETSAVVTHDDLPAVLADSVQLSQLFQNLVWNAIKFRGENPPRIHVSATVLDEEVTFAVEDNGIGIEPRHRERIFVVFQRLHREGQYPGAGIGLAVCKKIVERHGGRIWVEGEPGAGSTFRFTLPRAGEA